MEFKTVNAEYGGIEIKNESRGEVRAVFATLGCLDLDGDVTVKGAFQDGAPVRISAYGHKSWEGVQPVGRGVIREVGNEVVLDGQFFMSTESGRDHFYTVLGLGELGEWSYGFDVVKSEPASSKSMYGPNHRRTLLKMKVYEVSPVMLGAGIGTRTLAMKDAKAELTPHQRAVIERARKSWQRLELEDVKARLDAELRCAELVAMKDRWVRTHGTAYSGVAESFVDADVKAACWAAVHRIAPRLPLEADLIEVRFFSEEPEGLVTAYGDAASGVEFADFFAEFGTVIKGLCRPALEPNTIRINAALDPDEVGPIVSHELGHLCGMDEGQAQVFEATIRKEMRT